MLPSSFIISTKAPAGSKPASIEISIVASVWPALLKTPLFFAFNGKICPGLPKSSGLVAWLISDNTVFDLS